MNVTRIIINKLILPLLPVILIILGGFLFGDFTWKIWLSRWSVWILVSIGLLLFFTNNIPKHIKAFHSRNEKLSNPELEIPPLNLDIPSKVNSLDKRLSVSEKAIDISFKNEVIVHLDKKKQKVEILRTLGKKILKFNEISFLIVDNNVYNRESIIETFFGGEDAEPMIDKNSFTNSFSLILKNGKKVNLFKAQLSEMTYTYQEGFETSIENLERISFENAQKVIKILSHFMNKKYMVLDNRA